MSNTINPNSFHARYTLLMNEYPNTFEWVRHKARWEQIPIGTVLNDYKDYIDELMIKEDSERNAEPV